MIVGRMQLHEAVGQHRFPGIGVPHNEEVRHAASIISSAT
jgi:hypothetical protein